MSNLRIQPGEILWLERNQETKRLFGVDEGMLGHPVVILGIGVKGDHVEQSRHIQINIITSFGGQSLQKRHPGDSKSARYKRSTYIPIHRPPWPKEPHPDTKQVLPIETVGNPKVPCEGRTSYVSLKEPIYVGKEHLSGLFEGKANLTFKALQGVVKRVNAICTVKGVKQVPAPIDRPRKPEEYIELQPTPIDRPRTPEEYIKLQPSPVEYHRIIELDSEDDSGSDPDSDSHEIFPNSIIEARWCGSCQDIHYYRTGQASTVIPGCRASHVPLGQRNPNTAWEPNQSATRTPTVQTARSTPVPRPIPAISQRDPLLEAYYRNPSNYGSINGSVSGHDLGAARRSRTSWPPESSPHEPELTGGGIVAVAVVLSGLGYLGYRMIDWVLVKGELVAWEALRGLGNLGYGLVKWVIVEGEWVIVRAWEALRGF